MVFPTRARRRWLLHGCLLAVVAGGCQRVSLPETTAEAKAGDSSPVVACVKAAPHRWPRTVRVQGSLWGDEHAVIGAKVAGRVREVLVDIGAPVAKNAVLATLDSEEFDLQVRQAEAQVEQVRAKLGLKPDQDEKSLDPRSVPTVLQEQAVWDDAKSKLERAESLIAKNVISDEELQERRAETDVAEARYLAALNAVEEERANLAVRSAELGIARQKLANATIRAPFAGTVAARHIAPGVYLGIGQSVVTLVRIDPLRFRAGVPELLATQIAVGQEVKMSVQGQTGPLSARISRISPSLDTSSRSLTIEADVPNPGERLRTGLFAEAEIVVDPDAATLAVPSQAVSEFAGVEKVWLVRDGKAAEHEIKTGRRTGPLAEILDGLAEGDTVVAEAGQGRAGPVRTETLETPLPSSSAR
ncbi:MAG: efflux RND transporter periplasmic adaptor subunit [Pirellulales bacterium]|nr:efflux RND transporter periplasmic adaptor subunit [Pirellulales bacterium]